MYIYTYIYIYIYIHRKIPNISPGLIAIRKHILGGLYSEGLIFGRACCVSIFVSRLAKYIISLPFKSVFLPGSQYLFPIIFAVFCDPLASLAFL